MIAAGPANRIANGPLHATLDLLQDIGRPRGTTGGIFSRTNHHAKNLIVCSRANLSGQADSLELMATRLPRSKLRTPFALGQVVRIGLVVHDPANGKLVVDERTF